MHLADNLQFFLTSWKLIPRLFPLISFPCSFGVLLWPPATSWQSQYFWPLKRHERHTEGGACYGLARAIVAGRGIPDLAVLVVLTGMQILLFGLVSDQISAIRKEKFE